MRGSPSSQRWQDTKPGHLISVMMFQETKTIQIIRAERNGVLLIWMVKLAICSFPAIRLRCFLYAFGSGGVWSLPLVSTLGPRLALLMLFQCEVGRVIAFFAVVCSTWSITNRGTSCRDILTPCGQDRHLSVRSANRLVARVSLMILVVALMGGAWVLENPANSVICMHERLRWAFLALKKSQGKQFLGKPFVALFGWMSN